MEKWVGWGGGGRENEREGVGKGVGEWVKGGFGQSSEEQSHLCVGLPIPFLHPSIPPYSTDRSYHACLWRL